MIVRCAGTAGARDDKLQVSVLPALVQLKSPLVPMIVIEASMTTFSVTGCAIPGPLFAIETS